MMSDPALPELPEPQEPAPPPPLPPERVPFWGYHDLFMLIGLFIVSQFAGFVVVAGLLHFLPIKAWKDVLQPLLIQSVGYLFLFLCTKLLFLAEYQRPFWSSMGWTKLSLRPAAIISYGVLLAFAVELAGRLLHTPQTPTAISKLLSDRTSVLLAAPFGALLLPLCEELIFRGFVQPLFIRSLGAAGGILAAAVPFGLLHLPEYNSAWQFGVLITMAGAAFGCMRWRTGSTKASALMHAAYNGTFFVALLLQPKNLPH